jgi:hypothetical protein
LRLGIVLLGLGACEDPDPVGVADGPSRDRSGGTCFAEVLWDGEASAVEIVRDESGRLLSERREDADRTEVRELTWEGDVAVHRLWLELPDGSVIDWGEVIETYAGGRIVARDDGEVWSWTPEGLPETYQRTEVDGEYAKRIEWSADGRPRSARSWSSEGGDFSFHESWWWEGARFVGHTRGSGSGSHTIDWTEHDELGRPTRGEAWWSNIEGVERKPARWVWRKGKAVLRDDERGATTFTWSGPRLVEARTGDVAFTWVWEDERVIARSTPTSSETWTWDEDGWLAAATWELHGKHGEAVYEADCMRWTADLAPVPLVAPRPPTVPGPIDPEPPGIFRVIDP